MQAISAPAMPSSAGSRFLPSLTDVLFVTVIVWGFLADPRGWDVMLRDGDTGFHIRAGDWIRETAQIPTEHPFAYTDKGEWFAFEWLSQVVLSWLHQIAGLKAVVFSSAVLAAAVMTLLFRWMLWRGANPLIAVLITLVTFNINRVHLFARPHLFTWLFLVAGLWLLEKDRRLETRWIYALVPLSALWANLHGGFSLFLVLLGLRTGAIAAESYTRVGNVREARRPAILMALCLAATFLNPYGYRLHLHVLEFLRSGWVMQLIDEFNSPVFREEPMLLFMGMLFAGIAVTPQLVRRREWAEAALVLFLAYSSLVSVRHMTLFTLAVSPILALEISNGWNALVSRSSRASVACILNDAGMRFASGAARTTFWPAVFTLWLAFSSAPKWPTDFPRMTFPVELARRHAGTLAGKLTLTSDQWSDYLIYLNYPRQISFIDPQAQYYGKQHVFDYVNMMQARPGWEDLFDRNNFDYVFVRDGAPIVAALRLKTGWRQIDSGGNAVLFARGR